jgi:hypothetical protein
MPLRSLQEGQYPFGGFFIHNAKKLVLHLSFFCLERPLSVAVKREIAAPEALPRSPKAQALTDIQSCRVIIAVLIRLSFTQQPNPKPFAENYGRTDTPL